MREHLAGYAGQQLQVMFTGEHRWWGPYTLIWADHECCKFEGTETDYIVPYAAVAAFRVPKKEP